MGDQELEHLVHGSHKEDDSQLSHSHSDQTPQEDGREHRATERDRSWEKDFQDVIFQKPGHIFSYTSVTNSLRIYHFILKCLTLCILCFSRQFLSFSCCLFNWRQFVVFSWFVLFPNKWLEKEGIKEFLFRNQDSILKVSVILKELLFWRKSVHIQPSAGS